MEPGLKNCKGLLFSNSSPLPFVYLPLSPESTLTMTARMAALREALCVECAHVPLAKVRVIQQTSSLVPSSRGAYLTLATGTTIGQVCMDAWSGTDSFQPLSPILSLWENK